MKDKFKLFGFALLFTAFLAFGFFGDCKNYPFNVRMLSDSIAISLLIGFPFFTAIFLIKFVIQYFKIYARGGIIESRTISKARGNIVAIALLVLLVLFRYLQVHTCR